MHRVRHSLPYFGKYGWEAEVITVDPQYIEAYSTDPLLEETIPQNTVVHYVKAWDVTLTRSFGLGSVSIRSFTAFLKKGNELLKKGNYDLIYFTTTAFHVMALGRYWKKKFGVPFILDMQDPWRNDYYLGRPKSERPPKFEFAYRLDKYLENYTMQTVDGLVSVSQEYIDTLKGRYPALAQVPATVIPFAYSDIDKDVVTRYHSQLQAVKLDSTKLNIVYIGRGGHDLRPALQCFFTGLKAYIDAHPQMKDRIRCHFIGTSYAPGGKGNKTIEPVAKEIGVGEMVTELTGRLSFFETLATLMRADALFIPGSQDRGYTASKIYQYVIAEKPALAIFHHKSSVVDILRNIGYGTVVTFEDDYRQRADMVADSYAFIENLVNGTPGNVSYDKERFHEFSADMMTRKQVDFFNTVISRSK